MSKHIFCLRRGIRYVDENGATLLNSDGTPVKDDWGTYTAREKHVNPCDGELVVEFEYNPATGKKTPRFKLGHDDNIFANLDYISPDSFILPTPTSVTLLPDEWKPVLDDVSGEPIVNRYYQSVTVSNAVITPNSKVDLQPNPNQLLAFHAKDITFTTINRGGSIRVCVIGQKPTQTYTIQTTVTEVVGTEGDEIIGNTTSTPNPRPDWNQEDETKADYIRNKPTIPSCMAEGENENSMIVTGDLEITGELTINGKSIVDEVLGSLPTWTGGSY